MYYELFKSFNNHIRQQIGWLIYGDLPCKIGVYLKKFHKLNIHVNYSFIGSVSLK